MAPTGWPILVDDAILTLAVRLSNPLSYEEIATLLGYFSRRCQQNL